MTDKIVNDIRKPSSNWFRQKCLSNNNNWKQIILKKPPFVFCVLIDGKKWLFLCDKDYCKGWPTFFMSIFSIGILTAVIGDLAAHFGCYSHIKDSITAITIVALGTSVPGKSNLWQNYFFIITQVTD